MTSSEYYRKTSEYRKKNGLCTTCGKPITEGTRCNECRQKQNEYLYATRKMRIKYGLCPRCGKNKLFGDEKNCIDCRIRYSERAMAMRDREHYNETHREWSRAEHQRRLAKGICYRCNKRPADSGYKTCGVCRSKLREYYRTNRAKPNRAEERLEKGLCYFCDNPIKQGYRVCEKHYKANCENGRKSDSTIIKNELRSIFAHNVAKRG